MHTLRALFLFVISSLAAISPVAAQSYDIQDYKKLDMYRQTFEVIPDGFVRLTWEYTTEPITAYNMITLDAGCYSEEIDVEEKTISIVSRQPMGKLIGIDVSLPHQQLVLHTLEANPTNQNFTVPSAVAYPFYIPCQN
ncbi:hypothetical protein [Desulfovibrio inopinatus]|uniref:hypothetical protein n=1 Tax=Desulfovibrio inopinatus TaxID=102109 RepID=UPI0003F4CC32|nr:hypothetical protein [Desulfovibrio inopinatus]